MVVGSKALVDKVFHSKALVGKVLGKDHNKDPRHSNNLLIQMLLLPMLPLKLISSTWSTPSLGVLVFNKIINFFC